MMTTYFGRQAPQMNRAIKTFILVGCPVTWLAFSAQDTWYQFV